MWASRSVMDATPVEQTPHLAKALKLWCSGRQRLLPSLVGILLLCGCAEERCEKEIDRETAVQIARDYFLSRSIAQLESGSPVERKEAKRMRRAGMTEETYRETFQLAEPGRSRKVGDQLCGHPYIYYQAQRSLNYDGFDISFFRVIPHDDPRRWSAIATFVNVTKCGNLSRLFGTSTPNIFSSEGSNYSHLQRTFATCP